MSSCSASWRPPFYTVCRCFLNIAEHKCSANMFLLELRFFVFHSPRIKPEKKDRVFGSVGSQGQVKVSCFMLYCSLSKPETTFGMSLFAPIWHHAIWFPARSTSRLASCAFGTSKLARAFGARPSASHSVCFVYFWGFCPFQVFIVPIHRAITKNTSESTCDKSTRCPAHETHCVSNVWVLPGGWSGLELIRTLNDTKIT